MMLGEIGVGKTSIVRRLVFDTFEADYKATIGVDIYSYKLTQDQVRLNATVDLVIWDVDGDLGHDIYNHIYMKGASAACIVADTTRAMTHKTALSLVGGFQQSFPGRPSIMLLNKIDLLHQDALKPLMNAPSVGVETVWTSAKTGAQILDAFSLLGRLSLQRGLAHDR